MNPSEPATSDQAIEKIERELSEIDQIVDSWAQGKTLRFDPAHVKKEAGNSVNTRSGSTHPEKSKSFADVLIYTQLGLMGVTFLFVTVQLVLAPISYSLAFSLFAGIVFLSATVGLFFAVWNRAVTRPYWSERKRLARNNAAKSSRSDRESDVAR